MQIFAGLAPLVAFFLTYRLRGLYAATAVLMGAMAVVLAIDLWRTRRVPALHALSAVLVLIFGGATLLLHNRVFIQWKPTVLLWLVSLAFLGSYWIGQRTLTERFLGPAVEERMRIGAAAWRWLNGWSVSFYAALGALNLVVLHYASESTWVNFKSFGLVSSTFVFTALQLVWVSTRRDAPAMQPSD